MSKSVVVGCMVLALLTACSQEDNGVDTTDYAAQFYGKWQVSSGGENTKFIVMKPTRLWFTLIEDPIGLRQQREGGFEATADQINLGGNVYYYLLGGNQVTFLNLQDTIIAFRNDAAPDETQWLNPITVLDSIIAPIDQSSDIGTDGVNLWYGSGRTVVSPTLFKINTVTRQVTSLPTTYLVPAVEWDGTNLWCSSYFSSSLIKVDPVTGAMISSSIPLGSNISGIAWDGMYLWCSSTNPQRVLAYDPTADTIASAVDGVYGDGMAYAGGFLYICKDDDLHKCSVNPLRGTKTYRLPSGAITGVAYDGSNFWLVAATGTSPAFVYKIFKVSL